MQVNKNNIAQFLTSTNMCFMIPVYQRNYDWKEDNCKQLWNDIWSIAQNDNSSTHFIGTICSKTVNSHEKTIIDGQQRLTTITLLIKAIHDYVDNEDFKHDLDSNFLRNNGYGVTNDHRVKLHLNKRDDGIYNKLLSSSTFKNPDELNSDDAESRVYQNYTFFYRTLEGLNVTQVNDIKQALDRVIIVDLDVENENPQEIFESLNSTGVDLTDVDLLRNYLLMTLEYETQTRLYNDYWFKIEENVNPDNMVKFFVDYLIYVKKSDAITIRGRRAHVNANNLYVAFKDYYESLINNMKTDASKITELLLNDMYEHSKIYKSLVFPINSDMNSLNRMERIIYSTVYINKSESSRPVLLYIMKKYNEGEITDQQTVEMLDACLSLTFRAKVTNMTGFSGQFSGNVLLRLSNDDSSDVVDQFWKAITSGNGKFAFPSDEEFKESLITHNIFDTLRSTGVKYLFYSLEQKSPSSKGLPRYNDPYITVEHIMPKTLSDEWKLNLGTTVDRHIDYLNKLGNLTLTSNNSEMSNNTFENKKDWFKESSFAYTRNLTDYDSWSISKIINRGNDLANKCLEIWAVPKKYRSETKNIHDIKKRPAFKFSMIGLNSGDVVAYVNNPSKIATVVDDAHVEFEGKQYSLSKLASILLGKNDSGGVAGPYYFMHDGVILNDLRTDAESNLC